MQINHDKDLPDRILVLIIVDRINPSRTQKIKKKITINNNHTQHSNIKPLFLILANRIEK